MIQGFSLEDCGVMNKLAELTHCVDPGSAGYPMHTCVCVRSSQARDDSGRLLSATDWMYNPQGFTVRRV